jgi:hypothetical protein
MTKSQKGCVITAALCLIQAGMFCVNPKTSIDGVMFFIFIGVAGIYLWAAGILESKKGS